MEIINELVARRIDFTFFPTGSREAAKIDIALERMANFGAGADVDWSEAKNVRHFESDEHSKLFQIVVDHLRQNFSTCLNDHEISVVPFDANSPTLVLPATEANKAVELLLELEPLWIVSFGNSWCFEWRRPSSCVSGFF